ncbi:hypothetical protein DRO54_05420 [Candidatus Bathyarchaeota archaeon]|nr:MAG: hypothetical protein DRO54_05420 [Candidatus Bathyarchaeota archaeon]
MPTSKNIGTRKDEIAESLVKIIDSGLKEIFGEHAASIIYSYMEKNLSLRKQEIPARIGEFKKGLRTFLSTGAYVVEKTVLKKLYRSYGLEFEEKESYDFEDYLEELKRKVKDEIKG